jgi:hypothetical protein
LSFEIQSMWRHSNAPQVIRFIGTRNLFFSWKVITKYWVEKNYHYTFLVNYSTRLLKETINIIRSIYFRKNITTFFSFQEEFFEGFAHCNDKFAIL